MPDRQFAQVRCDDHVGIVKLNRPDKLNALNATVMQEVIDSLAEFDRDSAVRCLVLTGDDRAFAAGADIEQMAEANPIEILERSSATYWDRLRQVRTPIVAAVSGYCFGGGCELALACDLIVASETALFGQPEIKLGIIPGAGGTQRLTRTAGKARAMEMILTGEPITARQALEFGLVNRVVPRELYLDEAIKLAQVIAARPPVAVRMAKEAVLKAFDLPLGDALAFERKLFAMLFATEDQKEGMHAFLEKRSPAWKGK